MSYVLEAIIGSRALLVDATADLTAAVVVPLRRGLALVPMTDELFDAVDDGTRDPAAMFDRLPGGFGDVLAGWSAAGGIGYVEADHWAGRGSQRAAAWAHGLLAVGPLTEAEEERRGPGGSPISRVLAQLGAQRGSHLDEFDAVGLGRHRHTADWVRAAGRVPGSGPRG